MRAVAIVVVMLALSGLSLAHEDFAATKQIIDAKIPCSQLSEHQLEEIGDYYMEQMHPGEQHEMMHAMMGGENSSSVQQMHIYMARTIYCGETDAAAGSEMMGMMHGTLPLTSATQTSNLPLFVSLASIALIGMIGLIFTLKLNRLEKVVKKL